MFSQFLLTSFLILWLDITVASQTSLLIRPNGILCMFFFFANMEYWHVPIFSKFYKLNINYYAWNISIPVVSG